MASMPTAAPPPLPPFPLPPRCAAAVWATTSTVIAASSHANIDREIFIELPLSVDGMWVRLGRIWELPFMLTFIIKMMINVNHSFC
jgi:hypothetical protein